MDISVEPLTLPKGAESWLDCQDSLEAWNEAYRRVEAYFMSLRVDNKLLLSSLVLKILGRANSRVEEEPDRPPVELAAEETDRLLAEWFRKVLDDPDLEEDRLSARGRLTLMLIESKVPWQQLFLSDEEIPEHMVSTIREAYLHADPDFRFVEMRPRPIDLGIVEVANRTIEGFSERSKTILQWGLWTGFGLLLAVLFIFTR